MSGVMLLVPEATFAVEPQVAALAHLLADDTVPEGVKVWVRAQVVTIVARGHELAARENEGERS